MTHLLIVAHGTPGGSPSAEPANAHAGRIRGRGEFACVGTAFLRQTPTITDAIRTWRTGIERDGCNDASDLVVVPLFMAEGWYTRTVLPRELRQALAGDAAGRTRVRLTRPVGVHPRMRQLVVRAVQRAVSTPAHVVLIGHGTPRAAGSRRSVEETAAALSRTPAFASIDVAFLDEPPHLADVLARRLADPGSAAADIVVVPFFAGDGMHVGEHIGRTVADFGARAAGRLTRVMCTPAVGALPEIAGVIARLARTAPERTEWVRST